MGLVGVERAQTREAVQEVAGRIADMLRPLADTKARIPGANWTVGEAAAHLAEAGELYGEWANGSARPYGGPSREALAAANAEGLAGFSERDGARLADLIGHTTEVFLERAAANPGLRKVQTPLTEMDADTLLSYMLTHLLAHGCGIARALGKPVPATPAMVPLTLPFLTAAMPVVLKADKVKGLNACFLLHFRRGPQLAVTIDDGVLRVGETPPRRVDCHISADPVAFLEVALGNISQWGPILTGKLLAWGRKPWLALRFVGFFDVP